jgi:hypothetical protein
MSDKRQGHKAGKFSSRSGYRLLYPNGPVQAALRDDSRLFRAVFERYARSFREGRVYGGGLDKMAPNEPGRLDAGPVVAAIGE